MKKFVACVLALAAATAWAGVRRWELSQDLTGTAPSTTNCTGGTTATNCGLNLAGAKGWRVCVSANSGQTLSGAGTLQVYVYDLDNNRWTRNNDLDFNVDASGVRDQCFPSAAVSHPSGRVFVVPNSVTVSGGTTVETSIEVTIQ